MLGDSDIATIVGTRIFPVVLPQGETRASIVYTRISGQGDHHMRGPSGLSQTRFQIDAWAQKADDAAFLANLVKLRVDGFSGTFDGGAIQGAFFDTERDDYDSEVKMHRVSRDYLVWQSVY